MSKPINPIAVGGFTVGALILLIVGVFVFGGQKLLNPEKIKFVIFFDSSLNGLEIGAPVKMQGVKIGQVADIDIQFDPASGIIRKPVVVDIDVDSFINIDGKVNSKNIDKDERDKIVASGFRARLEMQSLLTGMLYVDFDKHPANPPLFVGVNYKNLLELPSIATTTDVIRNTAEEFSKRLQALPLENIVNDFSESLKEIRALLASDDIKNSRMALAKDLQEMEKTLKMLNSNLEPLLKDTHSTMQSANALVQDSSAMVRDIHKDIKPILTSADKTLATATAALNKVQDSMAMVGNAVGPESGLNDTMEALKDASKSIKELTDYLERHPESLLSGKDNK